MAQVDGLELKVVSGQMLLEVALDGHSEFELAGAYLDGHFPCGYQTDEAVVPRVGNLPPGFRRELHDILHPPQEGVGVQKEPHQV
jgi:hypothetical protein